MSTETGRMINTVEMKVLRNILGKTHIYNKMGKKNERWNKYI